MINYKTQIDKECPFLLPSAANFTATKNRDGIWWQSKKDYGERKENGDLAVLTKKIVRSKIRALNLERAWIFKTFQLSNRASDLAV